MATQSNILLFDFLAAGVGDGPAGGIEPGAGGITGSEGVGADDSGAGGVCVGGCGLVCGSINGKSPLSAIHLGRIGGPYL